MYSHGVFGREGVLAPPDAGTQTRKPSTPPTLEPVHDFDLAPSPRGWIQSGQKPPSHSQRSVGVEGVSLLRVLFVKSVCAGAIPVQWR